MNQGITVNLYFSCKLCLTDPVGECGERFGSKLLSIINSNLSVHIFKILHLLLPLYWFQLYQEGFSENVYAGS